MTDNRTTELREKLTERGVEFTTDDFNHLLTTNWWVDEIYAKYLEGTSKSNVDEDDPILRLRIKRVTPEQAIAATLGNSKPIADAIAELRKVVREAFSGESVSILVEGHAIMRAIDAVEAATLGWIEEPDTIRNELADGGLIADVLAPVCVDEKERRAFERGRVHERFAQQIFKEATS